MPANNGVKPYGLNYITANRFYVGIESSISASFSECQGLGVKVKYETYAEGGVNDQQRIFWGNQSFQTLPFGEECPTISCFGIGPAK